MKSLRQKSTQVAVSSIIALGLCVAATSTTLTDNETFLTRLSGALKFDSIVRPVFAQTTGALQITGVTASTSDGNLPPNAIDNNLSTRWSGLGEGAWIKFDLGTTATINRIGIAFYRGSVREADFTVEVSTNNTSWTEVLEDESSGETDELQLFSIPSTSARYVRIVGDGNDENDWNSITEVVIYGTGGTTPGTNPTSVPGSTNSPGSTNPPTQGNVLIDETNDTTGWTGPVPTNIPGTTTRPTTAPTVRPSITARPSASVTARPTVVPTARPTTPGQTAAPTTPGATQPPVVGGGIPTEPNLKIAFTGDTDLGSEFQSVLNLVKAEGAQALVIPGDLAYTTVSADIQNLWEAKITNTLGANYPYFVSIGNHEDIPMWQRDYVPNLTRRMQANGATVTGSVANSNFGVVWKGLKMVFIEADDDTPTTTLSTELANDNHIWKVCGWHRLMREMQVGGKDDQTNWNVYEACRQYGAIIATAHEHSYQRTKTLSSMINKTVDPAWTDGKNLRVTRGSTFAFVSALGGASVRSQERCLNPAEAGCNIWASIRTSTQPGTTYGAFFITFNVDGDPRKATAYFKEVNGQRTDDGITITAN